MRAAQSGIRTECSVCGSPGAVLYEGLRDITFGVEGIWNLAKCTNVGCGLIWIDPMPSLMEIRAFYDAYYTHSECPQVMSPMHRLFANLVGNEQERKAAWALYLDGYAPGRLLETGFGDGSRMRHFQRKGWEVEGQEFDEVAAENARASGLTVHVGDLKALHLPGASFDAVVGSHVLEHVNDPVCFLAEACRLVKRGGQVIMVTPNGESYGHLRFGGQWRGLEVPRHLHIFSPGSLAILARSLDLASFEISTTPINATNFLISSIKASREVVEPNRGNPLAVRLATVFHLILARVWFRVNPSCGEELILHGKG